MPNMEVIPRRSVGGRKIVRADRENAAEKLGRFAMSENTKRATAVDVEVGHRIRMERQRAGLSQTDIANAMGVTFQQVQKYEKGVNRVGVGRLTQLAKALKIPVGTFFEGQDKVPRREGLPSAAQLLAEPYVLRLVKAFSALPDAQAQRSVLLLVEEMAGSKV